MTALSRRELLTVVLAAGADKLLANPLGLPIGSQTWPHRQMIKEGNFAGLAKAVADMGVLWLFWCSPIVFR